MEKNEAQYKLFTPWKVLIRYEEKNCHVELGQTLEEDT